MNVVRIDPEQFKVLSDRVAEMARTMQEALDRLPPFPAPGMVPAAFFERIARVPVLDVPIREEKPARPADKPVAGSMADAVALGHRQALRALLGVLDSWITSARENHNSMSHRGESTDDRCWTQFHPVDIRAMVNDAAREMGLLPFPIPADPVEGQR